MADEPYRGAHDTLDGAARERLAARELGDWRYALLTRITVAFTAGGAAAALAIVPLANAIQRGVFDGSSWLKLSLLAGIAGWLAIVAIGKQVAKRVARRRTAAAVARIAARHHVAADALARSLRPL